MMQTNVTLAIEPQTQTVMVKVKDQQKNKSIAFELNDSLDIQYYTDPLCCWSYVFEPIWQQLRETYNDRLTYRYCMGGLIPAWTNYHDRINEISRPAQMGPLWMQAAKISGKTIDPTIWSKDPPSSSYPVCMAVKCADMQSREAGELYLAIARRAVFEEGRNVAKYSVLKELANEMHKAGKFLFDAAKFDSDMNNGTGLELLRKDIEEVNIKNINRFPSLIIRRPGKPVLLIKGLKTFDELMTIITN